MEQSSTEYSSWWKQLAGSVPLMLVVLVWLVTLVAIAGPVAPVAHADTTYIVQPGDTLISIASRFGVTVDDIVAANNLPSRSIIYAGQTLIIPKPTSNSTSRQVQPQPGSGQSTYLVQPGDTLSDIALRVGTTVEALMQVNNLTSTAIYAGQGLIIPASGAGQSPQAQANPTRQPVPGTYVVQPGDNLITLAQRFGVSREALAAANGISPSSLLYIGQVLKIPGPASQGQQPAPTATANDIATVTPAPSPAAATLPPPSPEPNSGQSQSTTVRYTVQPGDNLSTIAFRFNTTVEELRRLNNLQNTNFLRVGQVLIITQGSELQDSTGTPVASTNPSSSPSSSTPTPTPTANPVPMGKLGPKWIDVDLSSQTMVAFEGQTPVFVSKVSTGLPRYPTVEGTFRIYAKYTAQDMQGGTGADYYFLPSVPYVMYFYSAYALHGAYWHSNFGQPMSHGCVNLPTEAARWVYDWAPIGTLVITRR